MVADPELVGQQPGGPVGDPEVLGRWRQGGGQDLGAAVASDGLGAARAGLVVQPGQATLGVALSPQDDGRARATDLPGDLGVRCALGGQQQDLGSFGQGGADAVGSAPLAKGAQVFRRNGEWGRDGRHEQSCRHHSSIVK